MNTVLRLTLPEAQRLSAFISEHTPSNVVDDTLKPFKYTKQEAPMLRNFLLSTGIVRPTEELDQTHEIILTKIRTKVLVDQIVLYVAELSEPAITSDDLCISVSRKDVIAQLGLNAPQTIDISELDNLKYTQEYQNATLKGYTTPVIDESNSNDKLDNIEDLIAFCARVSNPANQYNKETNEKLLKYLADHSHWSPFEMANMTVEIETTRDIARQMLRHRSFAFQEFSQRYANVNEFGDSFVLREARLQDTENRQNSIQNDNTELESEWERRQKEVIALVKEHYDWAISNKIAKEQARCILPEGNTKSRLYMQGSIRSWMHFVQLRSANGTQAEHIHVAHLVARAISKMFPQIKKYTAVPS